jgi:hypothetical protein
VCSFVDVKCGYRQEIILCFSWVAFFEIESWRDGDFDRGFENEDRSGAEAMTL